MSHSLIVMHSLPLSTLMYYNQCSDSKSTSRHNFCQYILLLCLTSSLRLLLLFTNNTNVKTHSTVSAYLGWQLVICCELQEVLNVPYGNRSISLTLRRYWTLIDSGIICNPALPFWERKCGNGNGNSIRGPVIWMAHNNCTCELSLQKIRLQCFDAPGIYVDVCTSTWSSVLLSR